MTCAKYITLPPLVTRGNVAIGEQNEDLGISDKAICLQELFHSCEYAMQARCRKTIPEPETPMQYLLVIFFLVGVDGRLCDTCIYH